MLSSDDEVFVNEASVVSEASVNEVSVVSEISVNETSGSLTVTVSGDVETANGQPPLFFIVSKMMCHIPKTLQKVLLFPNELHL